MQYGSLQILNFEYLWSCLWSRLLCSTFGLFGIDNELCQIWHWNWKGFWWHPLHQIDLSLPAIDLQRNNWNQYFILTRHKLKVFETVLHNVLFEVFPQQTIFSLPIHGLQSTRNGHYPLSFSLFKCFSKCFPEESFLSHRLHWYSKGLATPFLPLENV